MVMFNPVDVWLDKVAKRHSGSKQTESVYRASFSRFCTFIESTPESILESWNTVKFDLPKREQWVDDMLQKIDFYESALSKQGLARTSVAFHLGALQSFFKHMRLPVPVQGFNADPVYHNRDITKEEIKRILNNSTPRDRAYFLMMLQSGLRPITLVQLRYEQLKEDFESGKHPSVLIRVPKEETKGEYAEHVTFIGPDAVKALHDYFNERGVPKPSETVFKAKAPNKFSMRFKYHVESLNLIQDRRPKGQPQQLRLYCLRKYFRNMVAPAGPDYVNHWMGHTLGVDDHYFSKDPEFHRTQYESKAMPSLQIYEPSPLEYTGELRDLKAQIAEKDKAMEALKAQVAMRDETVDSVIVMNRKLAGQIAELMERMERLQKAVDFFGPVHPIERKEVPKEKQG
jgi:integrase